MKKLFVFLLCALAASSCAHDIIDLTGDIQGVVKDYSGALVENCRVTLSPGGMSDMTDADGIYSFESLQPGTYTLSFSKSGYVDMTEDVTLVAGEIKSVDVALKDPSEVTGAISGVIKDFTSGALVSNCQVTLTPGGKSMTSSLSGTYHFTDLQSGEYSVSFKKAGYNDEKVSVMVKIGETTPCDVLLKTKSAFAISQDSYNFGEIEVSKTFYLYNYSDQKCSFEILNLPEWLTFDRTTGVVDVDGQQAITANVDRSKVSEGTYSQNLTLSYSGKESGSVTLRISMKKVVLSVPQVSIESYASSVKSNSFDIAGAITATGGSQILSYGHCWNLTGNPTIEDSKTDFGHTDALLTFKSTASNLSVYTTYYVRAYARNSQGITYSDQVEVTTQDVATDMWDGSIATSFSGGTGAMWDPYIIKTGGQLLLAKDHSDKYFELGENIDLNGKNWLPFVFRGTLDGKGYSISNLYINRIDDSQGLFSTCSGTVSNLTVRNVNINAPQSSNVGTLSGTGGTFNNCKVVLGEASSITGNNYVGGISGSEAKLTGCSVESMSENPVVRGNSMVGGLVGWCYSVIESCVVNAIVVGAEDVGGIVGSGRPSIKCCSFQGKVEGESRIGGIMGAYENWHTGSLMHGCKVDADVIAKESSAGGLIGYTYDDELKVIGCYAKGTVNAPTSCGGLLGGRYGHCDCYLCYAVMDSSSDSFDGLGCARHIDCATVHPAHGSIYGTNVKYECTDITTFLQDCYSDYASYWNYNNTWTWKGTINGKEVSVSCPRLAWEQ